jgi:hypothetical protein
MTNVDYARRASIALALNKTNNTPVHLWIVGILSLLWNAVGAIDYTMTETGNAAYLASYTPEQLAWIQSFPAWSVAAWAVGVWGALAGSVLLLLRKALATTAFAASLVGVLATTIWQYFVATAMPGPVSGPSGIYLSIAIWVIAILLLVYAFRMRAKGVLR